MLTGNAKPSPIFIQGFEPLPTVRKRTRDGGFQSYIPVVTRRQRSFGTARVGFATSAFIRRMTCTPIAP